MTDIEKRSQTVLGVYTSVVVSFILAAIIAAIVIITQNLSSISAVVSTRVDGAVDLMMDKIANVDGTVVTVLATLNKIADNQAAAMNQTTTRFDT